MFPPIPSQPLQLEQTFHDGGPAADAHVAVGQFSTSLEHRHAVVEVHRQGGPGELGRRQCIPAPVGVQFINESLAEFDECAFALQAAAIVFPISRVQIFHQVDTVGRRARIQEAKGFNDIAHLMAAVIENDIRRSKLSEDILQKTDVRLTANANLDLVFLKFPAFRIDVNSDNQCMGSEIPLPHLRRAAPAAADFEQYHGTTDESAKVSLVYRKVVLPLVNGSLFVVEKLRPKAQFVTALT